MAANPEREERASNEFDPKRHKVWLVQVERTYVTYVIAEARKQAQQTALLHEDEDGATADTTCSAVQLSEPIPDDVLPWGPSRQGHRLVTVNKALAIIADPPASPPPLAPVCAVETDQDWLRVAVSMDTARPVLTGVYVCAGASIATDGHRLHLVEREVMERGLWGMHGETIPGNFPNYRNVIPEATEQRELVDLPGVMEALNEAAEKRARTVTLPLPTGCGYVALCPLFLADALIGAAIEGGWARVLVTITSPVSPVRLDFPEAQRLVVVMPIRRDEAEVGMAGQYDLSRFVQAAVGAEA